MALRKGKYHSNVSFLDLLFNLVVGFVMLFIIAFLLIRPIAENKQIEQKAEYIISVTWPNEFHDDVEVQKLCKIHFTDPDDSDLCIL